MAYERSFYLLNSKFRELFFPTLLAAIAGNFAILADAFIISALLGPTYLSAIQSIAPLFQFINMVYWLIGFGGSILSTSAKANFDERKANHIFTLSLISVTLIALLIMILGLLFPDYFLQILCNSVELRPLVYEYYKLFILVTPFICYVVVLAYFIRTDNFVQLQFRTFLMANVLNVVLDVVFIKYFNMGISGGALAMVMGYLLSAIYISQYFFKSKRTLKLIKIGFAKSVRYLVEITKTGFSASSIALYQSIKLIIVNSIILGVMANVGLVAYNMCCNTLVLVTIFVFGTAQSILPIVAVYFQEKDYNGVEYVARRSLKIAAAFGIFFTLLFAIFPQAILFMFSVSNPADIPVVMVAIRIFSLSFLAFSINFLYIFYLQSIQDNKLANIVTLLNGLIFPVVFVFIFSNIWNEQGIWFAFVISEIATTVFIYLYSKYLTKKTDGEYSGLFLKKRPDENEEMMEFTISANKKDAASLSREIQDFLSDNEASGTVSLAIEDMIVHILDINAELDWIDLIIRNSDESTFISMKYSGIGYNPNDADSNSENIDNLLAISDNVDYSQILGLNNTVVTIKK